MNRFLGERGWRHGWQAMSMNSRRPGVAVVASRGIARGREEASGRRMGASA